MSDQIFVAQFAQLVDGFPTHRHQEALRLEPLAGAVRADVLHHHLLQPLFHPVVVDAFFAVAPVAALDMVDDPAKAHLAPGVLRAHRRPFRQDDLELLPFAAVKEDVHHLRRQVFERHVQAEADSAAPGSR